jgi:hypothetical protein
MVAKKDQSTWQHGGALKQFVVNSALLSLIDPVRGEPKKGLISGHADSDASGSYQLKEKFLDSFALICSTSSSGKETASAVCMEQNQLSGTILRIARNRGLVKQDLSRLVGILQILTDVAKRGE